MDYQNKFIVVDDLLSESLIDNILDKYSPEPKTGTNFFWGKSEKSITGTEKTAVMDTLWNHPDSPLQNHKKVRLINTMQVNYFEPHGEFAPHVDTCQGSVTIYLNTPQGGEFVWWDEQRAEHKIPAVKNRAVFWIGDTESPVHCVAPSLTDRFSIQIFIANQGETGYEPEYTLTEEPWLSYRKNMNMKNRYGDQNEP